MEGCVRSFMYCALNDTTHHTDNQHARTKYTHP